MDKIFDLLKDKKQVIKFLLEVIQDSEKQKNGLMKLSESLTREEPNHSIANIAKCVAVTMKDTANRSHTLQNLAIICLIYAQSSDFDKDIAILMNKMGRGEEALRQMFKNKLNGE